MEKIITRLVREHSRAKYEDSRKPDIIYAHHLERPLPAAGYKPPYTGSMAIGELLHLGVEKLLPKAEEKCVALEVSDEGLLPGAERFIHYAGYKPYVILCGSADGMYNGHPVEVKTTRRNGAIPWAWAHRARLYGFLYGTKAYLVVINVVDGSETVRLLDPYTRDEVRKIVEDWLRGKWPRTTLVSYTLGRD